ncbi:DUF2778 domain-containing protein [Methylobacterium sp. J-070]|uniref:DUF2778 domain-containing protein n=1 Tax=Methylobacterium sp. J-070 TaxID=2836650 RepID=UPI001FB98939|nr:DUF2778 domain-containing protein [Methylobacterium sp. J-070]MCJ2048648.1 DUF2778 domain-containing protein [Methylobacterium sp. J-070]
MAQAAMSRTAYRAAEPVPKARPRVAFGETVYDPVVRTRAPYPSAMRRARRRARLTGLIALTAVTLAGWAVLTPPHGPPPAGEPPAVAAAAEPTPALRSTLAATRNPAPRPSVAWMLDPSPALGSGAARTFGDEAPPVPAFLVAAAEPPPAIREIARQVARAEQARVAPAQVASAPVAPARLAQVARVGEPQLRTSGGATPAALGPAPVATAALVPLPVARPPDLRRPAAARVAARALPRTRDVFRAAMAEEPSFFEKLFGGGAPAPRQEQRQVLAYASPETLPQAPRTRISPEPESVGGTAVYDISARTVTLPSGEVLEAHSGLGEAMDNPRFVHLRMRGSTPPGTYALTERERLFHGVRAIRLTPVGGSGAIHGRDGLLAHTYMLRQPGASNGCVSFRDYNRFLQAFLRGEVRRLVVVAGRAGDFFGSRVGMADRPGERG